ncbi:MAG: TonB family protein [Selenomonadaceae bacterium]|nr:TonB family protein [Selenomonadaceae bacterium]
MNYSPHWSATIFAAIILNLLAALGFSFVAEKLEPEPKIVEVTAFDWVDVDLSDEVISIDEDEIFVEPVKENSSPFNAQDLFVPELKIPELPAVEEIPEVKPIERPKPVERPQTVTRPPPPIVTEKPPAQPKVEPPAENREIVQPPVAITEVYPEKADALDYKGFVSIAATIDEDGKVTETEILQSSGQELVDEIAIKAAVQWTFRPALDQYNRPLPSIKIIVFDFKKFS